MDLIYVFLDKVIYEFQQMYCEVGVQLKNLYIGGDEVGVGLWIGLLICQVLFVDFNNGVFGLVDLKFYFI